MARDETLHIRVSSREKKDIYARMQEINMVNISNYIRLMALKGCIVNVDLSDLNEAVRLMRINSNNLNQYAKKANETGSIYAEDIADLQKQQAELWEAMKEILARLATIQ